jgi:hypothetical protein
MNTHKLQTTTNYGLFVANDDQRKLDQNHAKRLAQSMAKVGFIPSKPVQCWKRGDKLIIVDGHHRYEAAKALGIPLCYVVESAESQHMIAAENFLVKKWNGEDFIRLYANRGIPDYVELLGYAEKSGLTLKFASSMLIDNQASSGNAGQALNKGEFKIKSRKQIEAFIALRAKVAAKEIMHPRFISAWSKCYYVNEFDPSQFAHKCALYSGFLTTCNNEDQALAMIEQIYNHKQSTKIPLAFLARESAKNRAATPMRSK